MSDTESDISQDDMGDLTEEDDEDVQLDEPIGAPDDE